ncbi:AAA family ATPase [Cellulomonas bogoriensis]
MSGGQKRRLAVGLALAGRPGLLLLDEPTTGLDVDARHDLWDVLRSYHATGGTVVLTSHYLEEVQALAERVVVIDHGRVLADDTLAAVLARVQLRRVTFRTTAPTGEALAALPGVARCEQDQDGTVDLVTADADALVRDLVTRSVPFEGITVAGASLEEAFLAMTRVDAPHEPTIPTGATR